MKESQEVGISSFYRYIKLGKPRNLILLIVFLICGMITQGYSFYFYNSASKNHEGDFDSLHFLKYFVIIQMLLGIFNFLRIFIVYLFGINISTKLHGSMLIRVLYSSINSFFNKNSIGKVLNRMSGDLMKIDKEISFNIGTLLANVSSLFVNFLLILIFTSWWLGVFYLIVFYFLWILRQKFSVANIILSKYESVTKSPYYALFSDFTNGNHVIRTFEKQDYYF